MVPLKYIEYGVYGDLIIKYPKPYSIYLRGNIVFVDAHFVWVMCLFLLCFCWLCLVVLALVVASVVFFKACWLHPENTG